jgi:ABC-2 type transport system ATP-binding protein
MNNEKAAVLAVENLSYRFANKQVLDQVSFEINAGECTILLGPNGAGKSTLFSLITHLYDSPSGSVNINGFDIKKQSCQALAKLGVVFQQSTLDPDLSVLQNLHYHAALHGLSRSEATTRIEQELSRQEMFERRFEKVRQLNGGHRRRVEIARALLHKPSLLLLDEPTVGLDVPSRAAIVNYIHSLCETEGIAVLWASHLIDEIFENDQLIVLHKGLVRAKGTVAEVNNLAGTEAISEAFQLFTEDKKGQKA